MTRIHIGTIATICLVATSAACVTSAPSIHEPSLQADALSAVVYAVVPDHYEKHQARTALIRVGNDEVQGSQSLSVAPGERIVKVHCYKPFSAAALGLDAKKMGLDLFHLISVRIEAGHYYEVLCNDLLAASSVDHGTNPPN